MSSNSRRMRRNMRLYHQSRWSLSNWAGTCYQKKMLCLEFSRFWSNSKFWDSWMAVTYHGNLTVCIYYGGKWVPFLLVWANTPQASLSDTNLHFVEISIFYQLNFLSIWNEKYSGTFHIVQTLPPVTVISLGSWSSRPWKPGVLTQLAILQSHPQFAEGS
jgi:hypothetical protein